MATKQTRRSISVRGTTYDKLRDYGEIHGRSMSDVVEELLAKILGSAGTRRRAAREPPPHKGPPREKSASRMRFNPPPIMRDKRPPMANRVVRAAAPQAQPQLVPVAPASNRPSLPGRPAPTPAAAVVGTKRANASEKDDYRSIRF